MIPLVKTLIPPAEVLMPELEKILYSGYVAQGEQVELFERAFEAYIGGGYSLSLNSGTAALHIALILAGVGPEHEVISTALTAEPTNVAIKMMGAKIRYADIDPHTGGLDPESIRASIRENTKAILVVDYAGIPVNVPAIQAISKEFGIPVIHDAAHALGAKFNGKNAGTHFPYTIFSLQAIKHITTIDGGILQLTSQTEYEQAKLIRWFGLDKKKTRLENNIQAQGFKYHMNNVNATIGLVQMRTASQTVQAYIDNGRFLDVALKGIPGVEILEYYPNSEPSYWLYTLKVERRAAFIKMMEANGFMASELHKRSDSHDFLNDFNIHLPKLDAFYEQMVHLPCGWWLSETDRARMVEAIRNGW